MVLVLVGVVAILIVLWDALETIILPRTVDRRLNLTTLYFYATDRIYKWIGRSLQCDKAKRERLLGAYGPIAILMLATCWAGGLILAFAMIHYGLSTPMTNMEGSGFGAYWYVSATTFFTLGFGDITPVMGMGRFLSMLEAGLGFGFLALVIGYVPVLYQNFSRREATILLLDARAGSPPTAGAMLSRYGGDHLDSLHELLVTLEGWAASLLESYLSYPVLAYYRSQHWQMSWLAALTATLDACTFLLGCLPKEPEFARHRRQAELTFAMCRHLVVDLSYEIDCNPRPFETDRLPDATWVALRNKLADSGFRCVAEDANRAKVDQIRREYEPYLNGLAWNLFLDIPDWLPQDGSLDSWQTSAWNDAAHF